MLEVGSVVKWTPPDDVVAQSVPLHVEHPGVVDSIGERHVLVSWVARDTHSRAHQSAYDAEWLTEISQAEFKRLASRIAELDRLG